MRELGQEEDYAHRRLILINQWHCSVNVSTHNLHTHTQPAQHQHPPSSHTAHQSAMNNQSKLRSLLCLGPVPKLTNSRRILPQS